MLRDESSGFPFVIVGTSLPAILSATSSNLGGWHNPDSLIAFPQ
jgi:hypothetical protein